VAITRTKNNIYIPETLMPVTFAPSKQIHVMKDTKIEDKQAPTMPRLIVEKASSNVAEKSYSVEEVRTKHKDAYKPWTEELDEELTEMYEEGINIGSLAKHFGRTRGAIRSRIKKLEL
jgi:DNA-directed RNA polymerase specialized sigma24 family protein